MAPRDRDADARREAEKAGRRANRRTPGVPEIGPLGARRTGAGGTGRGGISEARAYSPRGRTVRETGLDRPTDPLRPALRLVDGGGPADPSERRPRAAAKTPPERIPAPARKAPARAGRPAPRPGARPRRRVLPPLRVFEPSRRLRAGTALVLLVFLTLVGRLVQLQLTDGRAYAAAGLADRLATTVLAAPRGAILDRDGNVLAENVDARYVFADPSRVVDPTATALKLRDVLGMSVGDLMPKLTRTVRPDGSKDEFEYLARGVTPQVGDSVMALNLPGIGVSADQRRYLPGHDLAANLLGFTGDDMTGLAGLEQAYDAQLAGVDGTHTYEVGDGDLSTELPGGYDESVKPRPGRSLKLTIDRDLQYECQQVLYDHMSAVHADFGAAIVMKVGTGEILAQASYPTYDAAKWQDYPESVRQDAATQVSVEPGSVAKVVALGAALQEGVITPDTTVTLPGGQILKGDQWFKDTHPLAPGTKITIPGILAYSSNVGTITIASELGAAKLWAYQKAFGLGQVTGEGLPGESPGLVQPPTNWSGSSYGSIPIGLGIAVTPLQMTAVYQAIANNGVWVQPHLVAATVDADGTAHPTPAPASHRVLSPEVAGQLRTMLEAVTTAGGATGRPAAVDGYLVAGKTGTGLQVKGGTYEDGSVVSFVGMAPADHPQYVIGVFAHVPVGTGGAVAAPAFHDMMQFTLRHFRVPPDGAKAPDFNLTEKSG